MAADDPWHVLGIGRGADPATVRDAYHRLALRHHPDRGGNAHRMARINRAYEAVRNARPIPPASSRGPARSRGAPAAGAAAPSGPAVAEGAGMWASHGGQWLLVLAALGALSALWAAGQTGLLWCAACLLAVVAIADRRPPGARFHPAVDALTALAGVVDSLGRSLRRSSRTVRVSRRR